MLPYLNKSTFFFPIFLLGNLILLSGKNEGLPVYTYEKDVRLILTERCFRCHGPEKQKGKLRLDQLDPDMVNGNSAETWHDALNQLNLGEMPPEDEPQLTSKERTTLTQWLNSELKQAAKALQNTGGQAVIRRLNRAEY